MQFKVTLVFSIWYECKVELGETRKIRISKMAINAVRVARLYSKSYNVPLESVHLFACVLQVRHVCVCVCLLGHVTAYHTANVNKSRAIVLAKRRNILSKISGIRTYGQLIVLEKPQVIDHFSQGYGKYSHICRCPYFDLPD